jgi:hypothetical protein
VVVAMAYCRGTLGYISADRARSDEVERKIDAVIDASIQTPRGAYVARDDFERGRRRLPCAVVGMPGSNSQRGAL